MTPPTSNSAKSRAASAVSFDTTGPSSAVLSPKPCQARRTPSASGCRTRGVGRRRSDSQSARTDATIVQARGTASLHGLLHIGPRSATRKTQDRQRGRERGPGRGGPGRDQAGAAAEKHRLLGAGSTCPQEGNNKVLCGPSRDHSRRPRSSLAIGAPIACRWVSKPARQLTGVRPGRVATASLYTAAPACC